MNPIKEILDAHNISKEKVVDLFESFKTNPMAALGKIQELGLPQEKLQAIVGILMSSPDVFENTIKEYGLDINEVLEAKKNASGSL